MQDPFDLPPDVLRRIPLFAEISKVLSWRGGPVNWDLAAQVAVSVAAGTDPPASVAEQDASELTEEVRVAELWLAESCGLPSSGRLVSVRAGTPVDWAEQAPAALGEIVDPVAAKVTRAMAEQAERAAGEGEPGMLTQALGQMAPMFLGIQVGTIVGALATEVLGTFELGLPTSEDGILLVLPAVDGLAAGYDLDRRAVRQWAALAATAYRMDLDGFSWIRPHFYALYHNYVASLDIDLAAGMQRLQSLDMTDPTALREALGDEGLFATQPSPATAAAAARVGSFLAMLDAHAAAAVGAAGERLGHAGPVGEAFARRGVERGKGAVMLDQFVGLEWHSHRPAARAFVRAVLEGGGWEALNRLWEDPESFPTETEIGDPQAWLRRVAA